MITKIVKFVELPQPKKKVSAKMKELNSQTGALKRKLGIKAKDKFEPGDLIKKSKEVSKKEKVAIMGMI